MNTDPKTEPQTVIGIDLGDKKHAVCVLDQAGKILKEDTIPNRSAALIELARRYPGARIGIEVGTHSPWISRLLEEEGAEVLVANARKLRAIYQNERKCDRFDARMLAKLARLDPELLHPIKHISEQAQRERLSLTLRDALVRQRVSLIAAARGSLKAFGLRLPSPSSSAFAGRARLTLKQAGEMELLGMMEPYLEAIDALSQRIRQLDKRIEQIARSHEPVERLRQIPGVGPITALSFVLCIEDPARFERARDVGAYLGLVPRRDQSGNSDRELSISKSGNREVRRLLVQCAQYILGRFAADCELRRYGLKLVERGGKGAKRKAVVAVARKLAVLMLKLWKSSRDYDPMYSQSARVGAGTAVLASVPGSLAMGPVAPETPDGPESKGFGAGRNQGHPHGKRCPHRRCGSLAEPEASVARPEGDGPIEAR
jgi:transposase